MSVIYQPNKGAKKSKRAKAPHQINFVLPQWNLGRLRKPALLITGIVVVVALMILGWKAVANRDDMSSNLSSDQELVSPSRVYLSDNDAKVNLPVGFSIVASKAWRTSRHHLEASEKLDPGDYDVASFEFATGDDFSQDGQLCIENVSAWVRSDGASKLAGYSSLRTKQQKQDYLDWLTQLRRTRGVPDSDKSRLAEVAGASDLAYTHSADGKLSGVAFTVSDSSGKARLAEAAGEIDGQQLLLRFRIALPANNAQTTIDQVDQLIQSLAIDTAKRDKKVPALTR